MALTLRRPGAAGDPLSELAELWIRGQGANHDASCACAGMFAPVDPRSLERDLCVILADRYRREGATDLLKVMERRASASDDAPFERWIDSLRDQALDEAAQRRLLTDLRVFLESFAGGAGSRIGACY